MLRRLLNLQVTSLCFWCENLDAAVHLTPFHFLHVLRDAAVWDSTSAMATPQLSQE